MKTTNSVNRFAATIIILALALSSVLFFQPAAAATGQICTQYGTTTQGNYVIMNNRWGTSATQCINVTTNGFQIVQQDGTGNLSGSPVSYPAIYAGCHYSNCSPSTNLPMQISAIGSANTSVTVTYPGSGTYDAAYDIWLNADTNVTGVQDTEIMIWLNHTGSIQPIGSNTGTATLGGHSWAVWTGNNGANNVISYQSSGITSFSADLKPFLLDAITRGSGYGTTAWYLTSIQMGFEPWVSGVGLAVNSFSATVSGGGSNPTNTPVTPARTPTRTPTQGTGPTATFTRTPTPGGSGSTCSPITATITAPFTKDGTGTFCWQSSNLGSYINSWNLTSLTVNGTNYTNLYVASGSYPAKISGYWYVSYSTTNASGHFEAK
ncbi:MAG: hypothetical protein WA821_16635 [Anaerolineales bacterium]